MATLNDITVTRNVFKDIRSEAIIPVGTALYVVNKSDSVEALVHVSSSTPDNTDTNGLDLPPGKTLIIPSTQDGVYIRAKRDSVILGINDTPIMISEMIPGFETSDRGDLTLSVLAQDRTSQTLSLALARDLDTVTLDGNTVRDNRFFDVITGDGLKITVGNILEIGSSSTFMRARVLGIATDTIELDTPVNSVYLDASTVAVKSDNLRVNGSATPVVFDVSAESDQLGDFTRIILLMEGNVAMDSGTFGPLPALTRGIVMRKVEENGDFTNIMNFKTNGEFIAECFDHEFLPNNGQGIRMLVARLTWAGQSKHGAVQRQDGNLSEKYQIVIQDDLTGATFITFKTILQGHEV